MQLRLDAADRLVELVEEHRGPGAGRGGRARRPEARERRSRSGSRARCSTTRCERTRGCAGRRRPRRACRSGRRATTAARAGDLRRLRPGDDGPAAGTGDGRASSAPCASSGSSSRERFQTLANPGARLQPAISALTGLRDEELRRAPPVAAAVRRFLAFAGDAVLVAHNARFDMAFLDNETMRLSGKRVAATVVDTVGLARRLLGRQPANLAALAYRFATDARPCHRALPDAEATAEILVRLIGMAQERGARTVADLVELAATKPRRVHRKRSLAFGAPQRPGVYLFRDAHDQVLYVGRARDLRARLRSYFRSDRQRPAVEAALGALERIEWRVTGSELEAALEELRLIRELRPPANARSARPDRYLYLRRRGDSVVCSQQPTRARAVEEPPAGAARGACAAGRRVGDARRRAAEAAREAQAARARPALRGRRAAARPDRRARGGLRGAPAACGVCARSPCASSCRAIDGNGRRAFFVAKGQVVVRAPVHGPARARVAGGARRRRARAEPTLAPEAADDLLVVASFLRRPPPELEVLALPTLTRWSSCVSGRSGRVAEARRGRSHRDAGRRCGAARRSRSSTGRAPRRCRGSSWPARLDALLDDRAQRAPARAGRRRARAAHEEGPLARLVAARPSTAAAPTARHDRAQRHPLPADHPLFRATKISPATRRGRCSTTSSCCGRCRSGSASAIRVVDAGCGKAYMSLALVAYGRERRHARRARRARRATRR